MHNFVTEMCTLCIERYLCGALWDLWDGSIPEWIQDMDVFKEIHGKTPELHPRNDHSIRYAMCPDSSQIRPRHFRQLWICNGLAFAMERFTNGKLVVLWIRSFQVNMGTNLSRKFVNEHMFVIQISIPIVKCPTMLSVQSLAQNKSCKSKPET